jgi:hypothetical protein
MRHRLTSSLAIAATLTFLPLALCAQASPSQASTTADTAPAANQALQMVPASAKLLDPLDGKKLQPGAEFKAVLSQKVHLANGPELPGGTILLGTIATDDSGVKGSAKLAVQFTSAQLKDGQLIPIRAIIVGLYTTANEPSTIYDGYNPKAPRNDWNGKTLGVDQIGGVPGIDLHSKVASRNSGVFVATEKNDVKVPKGCDLNLAISAQAGVPLNASQPSSASRPTGN